MLHHQQEVVDLELSTITSGNEQFPGKVKVGNILKFGGLGKNTKTLAKVTAVSSTRCHCCWCNHCCRSSRGIFTFRYMLEHLLKFQI